MILWAYGEEDEAGDYGLREPKSKVLFQFASSVWGDIVEGAARSLHPVHREEYGASCLNY